MAKYSSHLDGPDEFVIQLVLYSIWNCPGRDQSQGQFYVDFLHKAVQDMHSRPK